MNGCALLTVLCTCFGQRDTWVCLGRTTFTAYPRRRGIETAMSPHQGKANVSHLKDLMIAFAKKFATELVAPGGEGRLPTDTQLKKLGPQVEYTRGYPVRGDW